MDKELLKQIGELGFPLFEFEKIDAYDVLGKMAENQEMRLAEGFPVVLVNAMEKNIINPAKLANPPVLSSRFPELVAVSLALYRYLGYKFSWMKNMEKTLQLREKVLDYGRQLKEGGEISLDGKVISVERLKKTFQNYYVGQSEDADRILNLKKNLGLEYAMSSVFSTRQKEIFLKKFRGERLSKTEREYYSRTVKKKVSALANEELHRMAKESSR